MSNVIVEAILAPRPGKNKDFSTLQLVTERERPSTLSNLRNKMLGDNASSVQRVVAFETMKTSNIEAIGLKEGDDFGKAIGDDVTIQTLEVTQDEYEALSDQERVGFNFKRNNGDDMNILVHNGKPVFRKTQLAIAGAEDKYVNHTGMAEPKAWDIEDFRELAGAPSSEGLTA